MRNSKKFDQLFQESESSITVENQNQVLDALKKKLITKGTPNLSKISAYRNKN